MRHPVIQCSGTRNWFVFEEQRAEVTASGLADVVAMCREVEEAVEEQGLHAVGFVSYEAAPAFDSALPAHDGASFPFAWFGLYEKRQQVAALPRADGTYELGEWVPSVTREAYGQTIDDVRERIACGETYQVNYTYRLRASFNGDAWALASNLFKAQRCSHGAYVDIGAHVICSASPELFFRLDGNRLVSRPMKGTAARAPSFLADEEQKNWLHNSEKNRAENVMIVDMIRNDMGRIAESGTVHVDSLYNVERYTPSWQMTSTVSCKTKAGFADIMAAMFPCASVTGAPKASTMGIIQRTEPEPRKVYTGCVGYLSPQRQAQFNVAIRTVLIDREREEAEFGVGGGVVWDSTAGDEYAECHLKAGVLTQSQTPFELLETMLWTPEDGYFLLEGHLKRLAQSAAYFGFPFSEHAIRSKLYAAVPATVESTKRVRLLLSEDGCLRTEVASHNGATGDKPASLRLARSPVDSLDPFLCHKTTQRDVYESARAACGDCDDVLLWNERGEVTETCIGNVVFEINGEKVTPPVASGLLPGTFRQWLIETEKVTERVIKKKDVAIAECLWVINSVRKWREAVIEVDSSS